jgi:ATP/ADP translocase
MIKELLELAAVIAIVLILPSAVFVVLAIRERWSWRAVRRAIYWFLSVFGLMYMYFAFIYLFHPGLAMGLLGLAVALGLGYLANEKFG